MLIFNQIPYEILCIYRMLILLTLLQTACSCYDNIDGAVVKCSGPDGPIVVEQLKKGHYEIRELVLENAKIVEVYNHSHSLPYQFL